MYDLNDDLISQSEERKFYALLKRNIKKFDIIIVSDYGHGIITEKIRKLIMQKNQNLSQIYMYQLIMIKFLKYV